MYGSKIAIYNNLSLYNLLKELKLDLPIVRPTPDILKKGAKSY